jgi:hypothetical protein
LNPEERVVPEAAIRTAHVNVPIDVILATDAGIDAPEVDVLFGGPDGVTVLVPAFQAGDLSVRARFAAPVEGTWTWESRSADDGLAGRRGTVEVHPYAGDNVLYRRGRLRVSDGGRHLEHLDGSPFLWIGDTWWYGLSSRLDWPTGFGTLLADRVTKGFSLIQIVAGPLPEFPASEDGIWDEGQANEAGWPWERDWARIDDRFYDRADERIRALVEAGLVPCIVAMWGYYYTLMGADRVRRHWRNLVARYAAYPVVFCVAGEVNLPPASVHLPPLPTDDPAPMTAAREEQLTGWSAAAHELRRIDPYHNPVTAHPAHPNVRRVLPDPSALDIDMIQTSHWSYQVPTPSIRDFIDQVLGLQEPIRLGLEGTIGLVEEAYAQDPPMVVVNGEPCYEGIMGSNWQDVQRLLFWTGMLSGLAGWTYGAQGIWQMNSKDHPELIRGSWGTGVWQDAMHYPGSLQVGLGRRLLADVRWWTLRPVDAPHIRQQGRRSAFGAASRETALYYLASEFVSEEWRGVKGLSIDAADLAGGHASWVSPRTLDEQAIGRVTTDASGRWAVPATPSMEDWLLVIRAPSGPPA